MTPKVSVVMPVHNGQLYLREAIESILNQTFTHFEFIIIDDASIDETPVILKSYADPRIVLIYNSKKNGLTRSLNKGLAVAQGTYIARMDADDFALPFRFERQVTFLEQHPEVGILGSSCWLMDKNGKTCAINQVPTSDLDIRWTGLLANPFIHSTVMLRRSILTRHNLGYDESFQTAQDYDLWIRLLNKTRGANFQEPLLCYRLSIGLTKTHRNDQLQNHDTIALRTIRQQFPDLNITFEQVGQLRALLIGGDALAHVSEKQVATLLGLYLDMLEIFLRLQVDEPGLKMVQHREILKIIRLGLRTPIQSKWMSIGKQVLTMQPGLTYSFLMYILKVIIRRFQQQSFSVPSA